MPAKSSHQVIVVGAGLSGLSAAKLLREFGVDVLVLEARDRVGGRTWTQRGVSVDYIDYGGSYVGPTQDYLLRMAKELGVETYLINEEEDLVFYDHGKRIRWRGGGFPPTWNPFAYLDMNNFFRLMDKMGEEIPNDKPWEAPHALEWDRKSFQHFMDDTLHTSLARSMVHVFVSLLVAIEPYECSLLWFLWYVKQCGGTLRIFSTSNGGQERKFKGGSQLLSDKIAERLNGSITLGQPVVSVTQIGSTVSVKTKDGSVHEAQHVILALSPAMQLKIQFEPSLPSLRNQLMQRMPMGSVIKCSVFYKTRFWRQLGFCGSLIIEGAEKHPVIYALDDTKPDGTHPAITGFITGDKCRQIITKTKEERLKILCESYAEVLGTKEALKAIHYEEHSWMSEEYSGGCYTGTCPPGLLTQYGKTLRKPIGRFYFAGTETATQWSGYMDGAISSGERAAREALYDMGKVGRDQIWQLEPKSKEVPGFEFESSFLERNLPSVPAVLRIFKLSAVLGAAACLAVIHRRFLA